jgi:hypothetical protein
MSRRPERRARNLVPSGDRPADEGFNYNDRDMAELSGRRVRSGVPQYLVSLCQQANETPRYLMPASRRGSDDESP